MLKKIAFRISLLFLINTSWAMQGKINYDFYYYQFEDSPFVTTASLIPEKIEKAPSTMTVLTRDQISRLGFNTLEEVLPFIISTDTAWNFLGGTDIKMRGIDPVKLMINGHDVLNTFTDNMHIWAEMGLDVIEKIEVIRGPGSALYGTNAFGGVVNIITKSFQEDEPFDFSLLGGVDDTWQLEGYTQIGSENHHLQIFLDVFKTEGSDDLILEQDSITGHPSALTPGPLNLTRDRSSIGGIYKVGSWTTQAFFTDTTRDFIVGLDTILTHNSEREESHGFIETTGSWNLDDWGQISLTAHTDIIETEWNTHLFPFGFFIPFDTDGDGDIEIFPDGGHGIATWTTKKYGSQLQWNREFLDQHNVLAGLFFEKLEFTDIDAKANFSLVFPAAGDSTTLLDITNTAPPMLEADREIWGFFVQDIIALNDFFSMVAGARYDDYSDFGSILNPRLAIIWTPSFNWVAKLLYGQAFKAPNWSELYLINNPVGVGNPDLDPEELESYEVTLDWLPTDYLKMHLSIYHNNVEGSITSRRNLVPIGNTGLFAFSYENLGNIETKGIEADISFQTPMGVEPYFKYAYTNHEDDLGNPVYNVAENKFRFGFNLPLLNKALWNVDFFHADERFDGSAQGSSTDSTMVANTKLVFPEIGDHMAVAFTIQNIFNEEFFIPTESPLLSALQQPERSFWFEIKIR